MSDHEDGDATQSDEDSARLRDSVGRNLPPVHAATGSCDSCSEEDANSHLGQKPKRKRVKWQTVATWDPHDVEEQDIQDSILSNARKYKRSSGLSFVAGLKKKPTNLDRWVLKSKKIGRDPERASTVQYFYSFHLYIFAVLLISHLLASRLHGKHNCRLDHNDVDDGFPVHRYSLQVARN